MTEKHYEEFKNLLDDCQTLRSLLDILEETDQQESNALFVERMSNVSAQCEQVSYKISEFKRSL